MKYATVFTDGRELGGPSLFDGRYAVRDIPVGTYTLGVEKVGYRSASATVSVGEGEDAVVDFDLVYEGKVSHGIYFQNQGTCDHCDLYASFLGQTFRTPSGVGFIKFIAAMPNVGNILMKFSIRDGGPTGAPVGKPITAYLEWGGEMIGAEFPGDGVAVEPDHTYFLRVERADGQGVYLYATDGNPYPEGMAYTGETPHPGWDLFATIRGRTQAVGAATGTVVGVVEDEAHRGLAGATVTASPSGRSTRSAADGHYTLSGLTPGSTTVSVFLEGYLPQSRSDVQVVEQGSVEADFTLVRESSTGGIEGTVRDGSGTPLSGVRVEASPGPHLASTNAGGRYLLPGVSPGVYTLTASLDGYETTERAGVRVEGGSTTTEDVTLTAAPPPMSSTLITNGDFSRGLEGWSVWVERGPLDPSVGADGRLHLEAMGHNGGVYQQFATGGAGQEISVEGFWASGPTVASAQWAELLVINGPGRPVGGADLNEGSGGDVILLFKNDTWTRPTGWSGKLSQTSAVRTVDSFIARAGVANLVLKSGNLPGVDSGTAFDDIEVRGGAAPPPSGNRPPSAVATAQPAGGRAPLAVQFDGSASSDPDGDPLRFEWDFGDGSAPVSEEAPSHRFVAARDFDVRLSVEDGRGGADTAHITISVDAGGTTPSLIVNGDFSQGLSGWSVWTERGMLTPTVGADGRAYLAGTDINGGLYQSFATGGPGTEISVDGLWASGPTVANAEWAEVLVIDSDRRPVDGQDIHGGQSDVVLLYKNDTWASPGGWSGPFGATAPVVRRGSFVASGDVATLVVKTGNVPGATSGIVVDDIEVQAGASPPPPPPPSPHDPRAVASAMPLSGPAPLTVRFDGSGSTDPDGDALDYAWDFGDGQGGSGVSVSHRFEAPGSYTVTLTLRESTGGVDTDSLGIEVSSGPGSGGGNLVTNGGFEEGFTHGVGNGWVPWSTAGEGYWKASSRLGRIGAGVYASGGPEFLDTILRLHPKIVLLFDQALGMAPAVRAALPDALLIGRLYIDHLVGQYLSDPERWGRYHAEQCYRVHVEKGAVVDAWQGLNEPFMNTAEDARKVARFEKAFSDRLHELGLKSVGFNLAVGNPGDMDNMLLPEVVDAIAGADYVGYHAYGGDADQLMVGPQSPWFAHRWRFYADMYRQRGYRMPPVVYTEATTFHGWKGRFAPWEIRDDLIAFEQESRSDPWSLGLAIFTFGLSSLDWAGWEVSSQPVIYEGAGDYNWEHPADAFAGVASQQFGSEGGGFRGGLVQRVGVQAGSAYRFTTSMRYRTYAPGTRVTYRMGVDPTGQTADGAAGTILWSADLNAGESRETDTWCRSSELFTATGSSVSIWIEAVSPSLDPFRLSVDEVSVEPLEGTQPP